MNIQTLCGAAVLWIAAPAAAQQTTECRTDGLGVTRCETTPAPQGMNIDWNVFNQGQQQINQQNQQNINRSMQNLGAAIAAEGERRRQRRAQNEAEALAARQKAEFEAAVAQDNRPPLPPPPDAPVLLTCNINDGPQQLSIAVALYEKHGRADVSIRGQTRSRAATFTSEAVTWTDHLTRSTINRLDMSFQAIGVLPSFAGKSATGTCSLAERKF